MGAGHCAGIVHTLTYPSTDCPHHSRTHEHARGHAAADVDIDEVADRLEGTKVAQADGRAVGLILEVHGDLEAFLKKSGAKGDNPADKFSVNTRNDLPQEKTEFVVLAPQNA